MAITKSNPFSGAAAQRASGNRGGPPLGREPLDEANDDPGRASAPAEPFSYSRALAGQEAELTGGYEREIAAEQDREREEYFDGWPA